jgi:hypothetical protein
MTGFNCNVRENKKIRGGRTQPNSVSAVAWAETALSGDGCGSEGADQDGAEECERGTHDDNAGVSGEIHGLPP